TSPRLVPTRSRAGARPHVSQPALDGCRMDQESRDFVSSSLATGSGARPGICANRRTFAGRDVRAGPSGAIRSFRALHWCHDLWRPFPVARSPGALYRSSQPCGSFWVAAFYMVASALLVAGQSATRGNMEGTYLPAIRIIFTGTFRTPEGCGLIYSKET